MPLVCRLTCTYNKMVLQPAADQSHHHGPAVLPSTFLPCLAATFITRGLVQDGTIAHEVKLTGILSTSLLSPGEGARPTHGTLIAPGVNAAAHQHLFCARLDMAVDDDQGGGCNLVVSEVGVAAGCKPGRVGGCFWGGAVCVCWLQYMRTACA